MMRTSLDLLYYWIPTIAAGAVMGLIGFIMILFERRDERRARSRSQLP